MTDRDDRSERLRRRFKEDDGSEDRDSKTAKMSEPDNTEKKSKTEETSVKDRPNVLMYLPEDLHEELDLTFDELNLQHKRKHGEALEKNRDWYPAVIKAGLENSDRLEDLLDL